jgi:hypothetical protein
MMIDFLAKQKKTTKQKARCTTTKCELHHPTLIPLLAMGETAQISRKKREGITMYVVIWLYDSTIN